MIRFSAIITLLSIILTPVFSYSSSSDREFARPLMKTEEEMLLFFEEEVVLVSATLHPQKVAEAPAIASVIKEDEIRDMGARDIMDVLNKIPGIHVTKGYFGKEEIEVRGMKTVHTEKVKLLIDGHSVNYLLSGDAMYSFDSLTVDNIKRIEVIRGPGSALYGSNAFSAIINVITKDGKDIAGTIVTVGGGSFNTEKVNLQSGQKFDDLDLALAIDYFKTDGDKLNVEVDDFGQAGKTHDFERKYDVAFKASYKDFSFNSKYLKRTRDDYIGLLYSAETDESEVDVEHYFGEIAFKRDLFSLTKLKIKAYIDRIDWDAYWELFPENFAGFNNGVIGNPSFKEKTTGTEIQIDQQVFGNNLLTLGALTERREQYDVGHKANFVGALQNLTTVQEVPNWNQEKTRNNWAVYLQDIWNMTETINITLGVRHDHYSDFGDTTNPRVGFVWEFANKWDSKLLYGTAFRAPSFEELYNTQNVALVGNPNLNPEKIRTYEASLGYSYSENASARLTLFDNKYRNKIEPIGSPVKQYQNTGGAEMKGLELEFKAEFSKPSYVYLNYTYQETEDTNTGKRIADIASHKGNIGLNLSLNKNINMNTNIFVSGKRPRTFGDPRRSASKAYELVDLTLIAKNVLSTLELRGSVHNLFDREYEDPAPLNDSGQPTIYNDFPREGITYTIDLLYKF